MKINEAYTVARFFATLRHQVDIALREGRDEDAWSMSRLAGQLQVRIFGQDLHSQFDDPEYEVAA